MKLGLGKILLVICFVLCSSLAGATEAATIEPVRCLMIGREPHRDPGIVVPLVVDLNANYPQVHITLVEKEDLEALRYENLKNYDVLLVEQIQVEDGTPPQFVADGVLQFLKGGGGLVVSHFAVSNVQKWRDSIDIFGAMWVTGKSTHGPYHEFRVDITDESHPIVEGVKPFITTDELYFNLLMRPDVHVIASGYEERFGHLVAEPLLVTHYLHNARCVYFALGHDAAARSPLEYRKILVQSIEWAACRR